MSGNRLSIPSIVHKVMKPRPTVEECYLKLEKVEKKH